MEPGKTSDTDVRLETVTASVIDDALTIARTALEKQFGVFMLPDGTDEARGYVVLKTGRLPEDGLTVYFNVQTGRPPALA